MHCCSRAITGKMEEAGLSQQLEGQKYKWTDEDTDHLIKWRSENEGLFTGRKNATQIGFEMFIEDHNLQGKVEAGWVKIKWENLKYYYRDLKALRTVVSTKGGETTAATWKWFDAMDELMGRQPSVGEPNLITSAVVETLATVATHPEKRRRKRMSKSALVVAHLREMKTKREERERREMRNAETKKREERLMTLLNNLNKKRCHI